MIIEKKLINLKFNVCNVCMGFFWFLYGEVFNNSFLYDIKIWGILYSSLREVVVILFYLMNG